MYNPKWIDEEYKEVLKELEHEKPMRHKKPIWEREEEWKKITTNTRGYKQPYGINDTPHQEFPKGTHYGATCRIKQRGRFKRTRTPI